MRALVSLTKGGKVIGWRGQCGRLRTVYSGFNAGDIDAVVALVTDDFVLEDVAQGLTFRGPAGGREWLSAWRTAVPDSLTEITSLIEQDDWIATEHTGRGTRTGPLRTPPANYRPAVGGSSFGSPRSSS